MKSKRGVELTDVKYPKSKKLRMEDLDETFHVYEGQIAIRGVLNIPRDAGGQEETLDLIVDYQACNDQQCLRPTEIKLTGKLRVAKPGEEIRQINRKYFPDLKK